MKPGNAGGGKGPQLEINATSNAEGRLAMSLTTPASVQKLQTALHAKAKESPGFRFYVLYDKVYRKDILAHAYLCCKANGGAAGVDDQRLEDIQAYGEERWLDELAQELKSRTYRPLPVRRVYIPKADGKSKRPLGIPAIRDRVAETAAMLILEPIFEADLPPEQYGYRKDRSALDAVRRVHQLVNTGHREIVDADLSSYFDEVPHAELLQSLRRRGAEKPDHGIRSVRSRKALAWSITRPEPKSPTK
jgi:RNA-directed DNA polymerase